MTRATGFEHAVAAVAAGLGAVRLRELADQLASGRPRSAVADAVPVPGFADAARVILAAQHRHAVPDGEAAAYLRGVAAGFVQRDGAVSVESVWSGPATHQVPVRATARVLTDVVAEAVSELLLMTYSARPYQPLLDALAAAVRRKVAVTVVVETLEGAGGALAGDEPALAFATVPGIELWHWPVTRRTEPHSRMHAKLAVADRRVLLVSSANLTQSGVAKNIEAGVLVRGGTAPRRAAEHIAELKASGVFARLPDGEW
ncbi:endonuclease [Amycolatopsis rhizosphaerae]|uniref:Endonuclease n=1 Tax=Amycolatopsis rhizosphaerae TaxID=2053003 RepID=A0A558D5S5_9PSEU|nr:DISARM system phospholipase D-like protein DrmC [Amycolatopsis rhizosphaerae]TVT56349.1 endonuclease [Amycolatopsis rhizosphaerae]